MWIVCILWVYCMCMLCVHCMHMACTLHVYCMHIACRCAYVYTYVNIWSSQRICCIEGMQRCPKRNPETKNDSVWGSGKHARLPEEKPWNQEWPSVGKRKACRAAWREAPKPRMTQCGEVEGMQGCLKRKPETKNDLVCCSIKKKNVVCAHSGKSYPSPAKAPFFVFAAV